MSEQELREKIIRLTERFGIMPIDDVTDPALYSFEGVADALIAAGIGDVSEWKEKAEQVITIEKVDEMERKYVKLKPKPGLMN